MFGRFLLAGGLANLADGVALLVWVWVASLLTRDAGLIALVPMALRLPWPIFAIPAGLLADRMNRQHLVMAMDILRAVAFLLAAGALVLAGPLGRAPMQGVSSLPLFTGLVVAAFTVGVAEVFRDNAAQTLLPALVPQDRLETANGRLWTVEAVANQLTGPALGAALLGTFLALPFLANAAAYAAAALLMSGLRGNFAPEPRPPSRLRADLAEALRFLRGQPLLVWLAFVTGIWNLAEAMVTFALVLRAQEVLGLTATQYGFVLASAAAGGMAAGLMGDRLPRRFGALRVAQGTLLMGVAWIAALGLAPNAWALALVFVGLEFNGISWNIVSVSTRQRRIPPALLGRVNSLYRLLAWGMIPLGTFLAGQMIQGLTPVVGRAVALSWPMLGAAIGLAVFTPLAVIPLSRAFRDAV